LNKILKSFYIYPLYIIIASLAMMLLLYAVYLIPVEKIKERQDSPYLTFLRMTKETYNPNFSGMKIDVATDARMVNMAIMPRYKDTLQDALLNPRMHYTAKPEYSLLFALNEKQLTNKKLANLPVTLSDFQKGVDLPNDVVRIDLYPRYWHSWLIFLKPLLMIFDIKQIKIIHLLLQIGLLLAVLCLMYKRLGFKYDLALITALCFLNPLITWQCLVFAIDVNIMLLALLWVLLNKNPNNKYIFFITGTAIVFNFHCYPLLTLGIPLITHICLYNRSFIENIKCVLKNSLLWIFGYVGMQSTKWILASIFTPYNILAHSWQHVLHRLRGNFEIGNYVGGITYQNTLLHNFYEYQYKSTLYYLAFFILTLIIAYFIKPYKIQYNKKLFIILGIGLMPFVWYFVLMQHTFIHHFFTHKTLIVTIYALLTAIVCCMQNKTTKKINILQYIH